MTEPSKDDKIADLERALRLAKQDVKYWKEEAQRALSFIQKLKVWHDEMTFVIKYFGPVLLSEKEKEK